MEQKTVRCTYCGRSIIAKECAGGIWCYTCYQKCGTGSEYAESRKYRYRIGLKGYETITMDDQIDLHNALKKLPERRVYNDKT